MANKSEEVKRIVFQPTAENREKLLKITETNGVSISSIINLLLDDLDINAKVEMRLINNKKLEEPMLKEFEKDDISIVEDEPDTHIDN